MLALIASPQSICGRSLVATEIYIIVLRTGYMLPYKITTYVLVKQLSMKLVYICSYRQLALLTLSICIQETNQATKFS